MLSKIVHLIICASIFFVSPVFATQQSHVKPTLFSEVESARPGYPFYVGVRLKMDPGWHTYWRYAGDSGGPTKITWILPPGFKAGKIEWPFPQRIETPPLVTYGYEDEVILLTKITPPKNYQGSGVEIITAKVNWLECADVCIPGKGIVRISQKISSFISLDNPIWAQKMSQTKLKLPLRDTDWKISVGENQKHYRINVIPPKWYEGNLGALNFYPYEPDIINNASPQKSRKTRTGWLVRIEKSQISENPNHRLRGILVSENGWRGYQSEKALEVDEIIHVGMAQTNTPFLIIVLLALVGGLLLNLMPCVLPVLSLKALGFVGLTQKQQKSLKQQGILYTVGVLISFWILAGILIILRTGGAHLGWGFQLQSPVFVTFMVFLFFILALNFFGVFEFGASFGKFSVLTKTGSSKNLESFLTGILATIVASPCTAPFMGTALGYGITQPPFINLTIFTFLGFGMALPYLLLTFNPKFISFLPRPGSWMIGFKQVMGFLLLGTVVWLLWVLHFQTSNLFIVNLLIGFILVSLACWVLGRWSQPHLSANVRLFARLIFVILFIITGFFVGSSFEASGGKKLTLVTDTNEQRIQWEPFSQEKVQNLISQGQTVFIDFTAAWCLTCQVNERIVFSNDSVIQAFRDKNVRSLKADWTNRDAEITKALVEYGRSGVPLYVFYGPNDKTPRLLPEILTPQRVLDVINGVQIGD